LVFISRHRCGAVVNERITRFPCSPPLANIELAYFIAPPKTETSLVVFSCFDTHPQDEMTAARNGGSKDAIAATECHTTVVSRVMRLRGQKRTG
jgi:hypothetical protein